jgi:hypothetical protein
MNAVIELPRISYPTMPESIGEMAKTVALGTIDTLGRAVETSEEILSSTKKTINSVVPATARFVGAFLLPEAINYPIQQAVAMATKVATSVATTGTIVTLNALSFGAPTWLKAGRKYLATSSETVSADWSNSQEFLAHSLASSCERPVIKSELLGYLELRKNLAEAQNSAGIESDDYRILEEKVVAKEAMLKGYSDFRNLKEVLDNGLSFIDKNFDKIIDLSESMAERVLEKAQNYYSERLGAFGNTVSGDWTLLGNDVERQKARGKLRDQIALHLKNIFTNELNQNETQHELRLASSELMSSFGVYRQGLTALAYTTLGAAYCSGGMSALIQMSVEYARETATAGLTAITGYFDGVWTNGKLVVWNNTVGYAKTTIEKGIEVILSAIPEPIRYVFGLGSSVGKGTEVVIPALVNPGIVPPPTEPTSIINTMLKAPGYVLYPWLK